eukprot:2758685-Pleurochrysis_carterae.AAC.1
MRKPPKTKARRQATWFAPRVADNVPVPIATDTCVLSSKSATGEDTHTLSSSFGSSGRKTLH